LIRKHPYLPGVNSVIFITLNPLTEPERMWAL
jgi:hypothetical protein